MLILFTNHVICDNQDCNIISKTIFTLKFARRKTIQRAIKIDLQGDKEKYKLLKTTPKMSTILIKTPPPVKNVLYKL